MHLGLLVLLTVLLASVGADRARAEARLETLPGADRSAAGGVDSGEAVARCRALLRAPEPAGGAELDASNIRLLSWNLMKGSGAGWLQDLERLGGGMDLLLLQEATRRIREQDDVRTGRHWSFAAGYSTQDMVSGVATVSVAEPLARCRLLAYEPWLKTPKATSVTRFALSDTKQTLVVVNVHMVNFSLRMRAFRAQLAAVAALLADHQGPVIVAGDFNTWRPARTALVEETMRALALEPVTFPEDHRVRFWGSALDHIFVGGLVVDAATTHRVESSDHNPMSIRVRL